MMSECKSCCGDGVERCDNPDHGFIGAMSFHDIGRIGCPCCGHNPDYKMKSWKDGKWEWNKCPECNGTGLGATTPDNKTGEGE